MIMKMLLPFVSSSTSKRHLNMMCSKSRERYKEIPLTIFKVIGIVSIFVAPIALLQVISATDQQQQKLKQREEIRQEDGQVGQSYVNPQIAQSNLQSIENRKGHHHLHQSRELLGDINKRKDVRDSESILLRLRRQTDDETRQHLAKLTASGAAAGMIFGDQMAAAQMAAAAEQANYHPEYGTADEDDDNGGTTNIPNGQNVDLSTLQSNSQQTGPRDAEQSYNPIMAQDYHQHQQQQQQQQQQQPDAADKIDFEHMPDSMDSLLRSEQEDMTVDPGDTSEQSNNEKERQQSSVASSIANNQQQANADERDGDDYRTNNNPNTLQDAQNLPRSYLPMQGGQLTGLIQGTPNYLSGTIFPNGISSPIIDSSDDLNVAAGHHYKKKKKQKKVKKIIIKKKKKVKKYKKIKKIKVIKYKKKKVYKKKKKPMKYHHHKHHHKHHHHDHGKYYMYVKVPKKKSWEFGFKKGNKKHWIERHEKGHKNKFKTKVEWYDKKSKGKGVHIWDYNHHDKKKKKHF